MPVYVDKVKKRYAVKVYNTERQRYEAFCFKTELQAEICYEAFFMQRSEIIKNESLRYMTTHLKNLKDVTSNTQRILDFPAVEKQEFVLLDIYFVYEGRSIAVA